ncbi:flippase-like domain-containing protein [Myxococcota bacterium]|nr:flippase-like domain-containing protein [Myxococcota bacterium]
MSLGMATGTPSGGAWHGLVRAMPWVVTVVLALALLAQIGPDLRDFLSLRWGWVGSALTVSVVGNVFLASVKLWLLMRWTAVHSLGLWGTHRMILGLLAATFFAPFQSGHVLYVAALGRLARIPLGRALEIIVLDKWLTVCATAAWMAVGGVFVPEGPLPGGPWWTAAALGVATSPWWLRVLRPIGLRIPRLAATFRLVSNPISPGRVVVLMLLAVLYQSTDILATWMGSRALGAEVSWTTAMAVVPPVIFASWMPLSVSGIGIRERALAFLLGSGTEWHEGLQMGVLVDFTEYLAPALLGLWALPSLLRRLSEPDGSGGRP